MGGRLFPATIATGTVGAGVMLAFDGLVPRIIGVFALFAFLVCGLFLVADPAYLSGDAEQPETAGDQPPGSP
jgi:hypothetical protein